MEVSAGIYNSFHYCYFIMDFDEAWYLKMVIKWHIITQIIIWITHSNYAFSYVMSPVFEDNLNPAKIYVRNILTL